MSLRRTNIGTITDMVRISAAVSRPGIDPRIWCSVSYAAGESRVDPNYGDLVDVVLLPSEQRCTLRVPQGFAGPAYGENEARIHKDDELIALFPDGDPMAGGIVAARLWSTSDKPPQLVVDHPADYVHVREPGTNWRVKLQGAGQFLVEAEDKANFKVQSFVAETGSVRLGAATATEQLVKGTTYGQAEQTFLGSVGAAATATVPAGALLTSAGALMVMPIVGAIVAAPMVAAAGGLISTNMAAIATACTTFSAPYSTYLSTVSKTT
jgi:hypothetical protein